MAARQIVIYGDPVLREVAEPVDEVDQATKDLVLDMIDTLKKANGLGLAAPQVGVSKRIFIVDVSAVELDASVAIFINPEILDTSGMTELEEGCLSFPDIYQKIVRPSDVKVRATDLDGNRFELSAAGMMARTILHEYDHLEGKLFIDMISPMAKALLKGKLKKLAKAS